METTNVFEQLKILQDILAEKYEIESKIEDAPKDLGLQDELLVRLKEEYIGINAAYEAAKTKISQLKADLDEAVAARERGEKGMDTIREHAEEIIRKRLAPAEPANDGEQTPMRGAPKGHPVFLAQHATATCCRGCLEKWHGIEKGRELTASEQQYVANIIMRWIDKNS